MDLRRRVLGLLDRRERKRLPIVVCTHHKTGTVWMHLLFRDLAEKDPRYKFLNLHLGRPEIVESAEEPTPIFFEPRGKYSLATSIVEDFVGLHVIRDPRDVIISGAHYHQKSSEAWLHVPDDEFGGRTYQEMINSLPQGDKLRFEMERKGGATVRDMVEWNYDDERFLNVKYEDLVTDIDLSLFRRVFHFLQFDRLTTRLALRRTKLISIQFSDRARNRHVRSGKPRQWETEFTRQDGERFVGRFESALLKLGYETDNSWVERLQ